MTHLGNVSTRKSTLANRLYYGDNLAVLRSEFPDECVDLIYLDPPFNSQATYNVLYRSATGSGSQAQIEAFEDTWHWGIEAERALDEILASGNATAAELLRALHHSLGTSDMMAYLAMMSVRLLELHRVLKSTGSVYLHCDPTASHYLRIVLDAIFGAANFRNEIIWRRYSAHGNASKRFGSIHDTILFYTKSEAATWNATYGPLDDSYVEQFFRHVEAGTGRRYRLQNVVNPNPDRPNLTYEWNGHTRVWKWTKDKLADLDAKGLLIYSSTGFPALKQYLDESKGRSVQDLWTDIASLQSNTTERLNYPTQKPLALLERIITASSNAGDLVLDPFCGCGTTVHAAESLRRRWVGIDVTHLAISLIERRLKRAFPGINIDVHGAPRDFEGARDLALRDKYQFQWWALSLVDAQPFAGKKKGADSGIDGVIYFRPDGKHIERAIVSVKGGDNTTVSMVRDLKGVMAREDAPISVFLTLTEPTAAMRKEAATAGFYTGPHNEKYPRLQLLTIEEVLAGKRPTIPLVDISLAFRSPQKAKARNGEADLQLDL